SSSEDLRQTADPVLNNILNTLETLDFPNFMPAGEFSAIPEETSFMKADEPTTIELEDVDNSLKIPIVSADIANISLET
ncbi:11293_t:CDS:2, partial [Gigaspora rosea]